MTRFRLYTDQAIDAKLAQHRKDITAQLADTIERMLPPPCKHRDGRVPPSCTKCAERRTVQAAAKVVRETGGTP